MTAAVEHETELDTLAVAALDFANALRAQDGNEPATVLARGRQRNIGRCPIAATAGRGWMVSVEAFKVVGGSALKVTPVPSSVQDFMAAFDAGMYPDLIAEAS